MSPRSVVVTVLLTVAALGSWYLARQDSGDDESATTNNLVHRGRCGGLDSCSGSGSGRF